MIIKIGYDVLRICQELIVDWYKLEKKWNH